MTAALPRYALLTDELRQQITQGDFALGQKLPSEIELAASFGVSRATLRRALDELEAEGLLERRRRVGTVVVATRPTQSFHMAMRSFPEVMSLTRLSHLQILGTRHVANGSSPRLAGRQSQTGYWLEISALRYLSGDDRPVSWLVMYVDGRYAGIEPALEQTAIAVYQVIERTFDIQIDRLHQSVGAVLCPEIAAKALGMQANDPVIELDAELYHGGELVEITYALYDPARFKITSDIVVSETSQSKRK